MNTKSDSFKTVYSINSIKKWICREMSAHAWNVLLEVVNTELQKINSNLISKKVTKSTYIETQDVNLLKSQFKALYGLEIPLTVICKDATRVEIESSSKRGFFNLLF